MVSGSPTQLILIRHGETAWTEAKRFQGHSDIELNDFGKKQARLVAAELKHRQISPGALYTSGLKRAIQTGAAIAKALRMKTVGDARINEYFFGRWEGKTALDLARAKEPAYLKWCKGDWVNPPGGEKLIHFRKRVRSFLRFVLNKHQGQKIVLVSHGGPIKMLLFEALELPFRSFWSFRIDTASISIVSLNARVPQLMLLNERAHLKGLLKNLAY